ncbi:hypothetical protein ACW9UR_12990 [Halovulum sp. GXIMD14794]
MKRYSRPAELGQAESVVPGGHDPWREKSRGRSWLRTVGYWSIALVAPLAVAGEMFWPEAERTQRPDGISRIVEQAMRVETSTTPEPASKSAEPAPEVASVSAVIADPPQATANNRTTSAAPSFTPQRAPAPSALAPVEFTADPPPIAPRVETARNATADTPVAPEAEIADAPPASQQNEPGERPRYSMQLTPPPGLARTRGGAIISDSRDGAPRTATQKSTLGTPDAGPNARELEAVRRELAAIADPRKTSARADAREDALTQPEDASAFQGGRSMAEITGSPPPAVIGTRVAIHVPYSNDNAFGRRIAQYLMADGLDVFALRSFRFGLNEPNVRYFHPSDRPVAERVTRVLTAYGHPANLQDFTHFRPTPEPGLIEVWIAPGESAVRR